MKQLLVGIVLFTSFTSFAQSKVMDDLAKANDYTTLYFYPSTLRMLSKILASDQGAAFKEIKRARLVFTWESDEALSTDLNSVGPKLEKDGFENIMTMRTQGNNVNAYLKESTPPVYIFSFSGEGGVFILELQGTLSMRSLQSIATMDPSEAMNILELKAPEKEVKTKPETSKNTEE